MSHVTQLISEIREGNQEAPEQLSPLVYDEFRKLAAYKMERERNDHTLLPTALVHEAYVRLIGSDDKEWSGRGHLFRAAAKRCGASWSITRNTQYRAALDCSVQRNLAKANSQRYERQHGETCL